MASSVQQRQQQQPQQPQGAPMARWDPFAELQRLSSELGRLLDSGDVGSLLGDGWMPLADIEETDDAYVVELDVPGVKKNDVDISLSGRRLTVAGEVKEKERKGVVRRRARRVGRFYAEIVLPGAGDPEGVSASLDDGVLTIRVPKAAGDRPRRIQIK